MASNFEFYAGLRGYHVYSNIVSSKPYVGQKITFKIESIITATTKLQSLERS